MAGPVLAAVDLSEVSGAVVLEGLRKAAQSGSPLCLLHVIRDPAREIHAYMGPGGFGAAPPDVEEPNFQDRLLEVLQEDARRRLRGLLARRRAGRTVEARIEVRYGDPALRILEVQQEHGASLIVVGLDRTGEAGAAHRTAVLLRIVGRAGCPVKVVGERRSAWRGPRIIGGLVMRAAMADSLGGEANEVGAGTA